MVFKRTRLFFFVQIKIGIELMISHQFGFHNFLVSTIFCFKLILLYFFKKQNLGTLYSVMEKVTCIYSYKFYIINKNIWSTFQNNTTIPCYQIIDPAGFKQLNFSESKSGKLKLNYSSILSIFPTVK